MHFDEVDALMRGLDFESFAERVAAWRPLWVRDGACREHPELSWFPDRGGDTSKPKAVCRGCLVRESCLEFALADGAIVGIWGGTSAEERRQLRRGQSAA